MNRAFRGEPCFRKGTRRRVCCDVSVSDTGAGPAQVRGDLS